MTEQMKRALEQYQTPFYLFDPAAAAARVEALRRQMPARVKLCFAIKANPFLVKGLEQAVDKFEVCSPGEFRICERAGIDLGKVVLSGVYKNPVDIVATVARYGDKLTYTVESETQWKLLSAAAEENGCVLPVLLRLSMGSQFGMDPTLIKTLLMNGAPGLDPEGIQFFSGTQKKNPKRIRRELEELDTFLGELKRELNWCPQMLEYGPGLPVCYFAGESDTSGEMVQTLAECLKAMNYQGAVTLELGRYFAACAGEYATRIVDLKTNLDRPYCLVDGGIHQVNYYGQMLATKRPPVEVLPARAGAEISYTVCGSLCTTNDILLKEFPLTDPEIGDALVFAQTGAYSPMEGMLLFLSRDLPQVVLYDAKEGLRLVRDAVPTDPLNSADINTKEC